MFSISDTYKLGKELLAQVALDISSYDAVFDAWHKSKKRWIDAVNPDTGAVSWPAEIELTGGERSQMWVNAISTYSRTIQAKSDLHIALARLRSYFPIDAVQYGTVTSKLVLTVPSLSYDKTGSSISIQLRKGTKFSRAASQFLRDLGIAEDVAASTMDKLVAGAGFVATKGTMTLSFNLVDILLSSMCASFSSCHDLMKEHASGNLQYVCDPHTGVAYFHKDERAYSVKSMTFPKLPFKTWRQLVVFDHNSKSVTFLRHYPQNTSISENNHRSLRQKCATAVEKALGLDHAPWVYNTLSNDKETDRERLAKALVRGNRRGSNAYMDWCTAQIHHPTGHMEFTYSQDHPVCPSCGNRQLMGSSRFMCDNCLKKYKPCYFCKKHMTSGGSTLLVGVSGESCQPCLAIYALACTSCGAHSPRGVESYHLVTGERLCQTCWRGLFFSCTGCGSNFPNNEALRSPTNNLRLFCSRCYERRFKACVDCGTVVSTSSIYDGVYCEMCYVTREENNGHDDDDNDDDDDDDDDDDTEEDDSVDAPPPILASGILPPGWTSISTTSTTTTNTTTDGTNPTAPF